MVRCRLGHWGGSDLSRFHYFRRRRALSEVIQFRIAKWHRRIAKSRQLLRGTIVCGVVGYLLLLAALQLAPRTKDVDLMILFGALILFGSVTFAVAVVRLVQFLRRQRQEQEAAG